MSVSTRRCRSQHRCLRRRGFRRAKSSRDKKYGREAPERFGTLTEKNGLALELVRPYLASLVLISGQSYSVSVGNHLGGTDPLTTNCNRMLGELQVIPLKHRDRQGLLRKRRELVFPGFSGTIVGTQQLERLRKFDVEADRSTASKR